MARFMAVHFKSRLSHTMIFTRESTRAAKAASYPSGSGSEPTDDTALTEEAPFKTGLYEPRHSAVRPEAETASA